MDMYLYLIISNDVMMLCSVIRVNRRSREDITVKDYTLLLTDRYARVCFISIYGDRTDRLCARFYSHTCTHESHILSMITVSCSCLE